MDYEKFHQAVVLAYINLDGNSEKFGDEVINILNEFRENKQAAEHKMYPTLLESRRKMVTCPLCLTVFGVELPAPQSG